MTSGARGKERLRLAAVDDSNRDAVLALQVKIEQLPLVASNKKSLRQASEDPTLVPRALVEGDAVVGFAMYQRRKPGEAYIWRVMIGDAQQGRGLGRRLMELVLDELREAGFRTVLISHRPQNRAAARLFESVGFIEDDFDPDGEVIRKLELGPRRP